MPPFKSNHDDASLVQGTRDFKDVGKGGVSSIEDIRKLSALEEKGLYGCIVGKAIYDGRVDLKEGLKEFKQ